MQDDDDRRTPRNNARRQRPIVRVTRYYFEYGDDDSGQVLLEPSSREAELLNLDLEWDFGFATFTSSSSVLESRRRRRRATMADCGPLSRNDWNWLLYGGEWPRPAQRAERGYDDEGFHSGIASGIQ